MSGDSVFKTCWEHAGGDPELALWFAIVAKRYEMDLDVLDGQRRCICPCNRPIPRGSRPDKRYFSTACRQRDYRARKAA
jgi:hypothetical protein